MIRNRSIKLQVTSSLGFPFIVAKSKNIRGGFFSNELLERFWVNFLSVNVKFVANRKDMFSDTIVFVKDEFIKGYWVDRNRWLMD